MKRVIFFKKKFFAVFLFLYACNGKKTGPYAAITLMPDNQERYKQSLVTPPKPEKNYKPEADRVVSEIISEPVLASTLRLFDKPPFEKSNEIGEYMESFIHENSGIITVRLYNSDEFFSVAFLDSLVKEYNAFRNQQEQQVHLRRRDSLDRRINAIQDTIMLLTDTLIAYQEKNPQFENIPGKRPFLSSLEKEIRENDSIKTFYTAVKMALKNDALQNLSFDYSKPGFYLGNAIKECVDTWNIYKGDKSVRNNPATDLYAGKKKKLEESLRLLLQRLHQTHDRLVKQITHLSGIENTRNYDAGVMTYLQDRVKFYRTSMMLLLNEKAGEETGSENQFYQLLIVSRARYHREG